MSIIAMDWARAQKLTHTRSHILKELANRADDNGLCWPSLNRLANDANLCRRTVIRCLNDLVALGLIAKGFRQGHSTVYRLQLHQAAQAEPAADPIDLAEFAPAPAEPVPETAPVPKTGVVTQSHPPVTESHPPGDRESPPVVTQSHPESKVETKGKPQGNQSGHAGERETDQRSSNVVSFVPSALREPPKPVETYSPAWEPVYEKAVAQRAAEQERLQRSVKAALPELERLDREARARQLARLGKMQAAG